VSLRGDAGYDVRTVLVVQYRIGVSISSSFLKVTGTSFIALRYRHSLFTNVVSSIGSGFALPMDTMLFCTWL
jgi:hypothetical protein